ncbi:RNA polymerase, sigma 28 subunit, FliA/WhiG family [Caldicellulosiruptor saccharolyticus DSM 8903]|uniref:RNA polymerase sigma factor n=1 Tax=Caldicellulosiruptor saccharolyticus (strain ATCC 43494 / DSM 8903 / Tp8T 6331) TaxID=351627 RepID=A4XK14_CALS8|nr:SigF/SigG family RNA polymerase sporulation sigma factor [Caldicellulosiruptor saccharolyticus]ABP67249.2 RNA polymerase, sigma 28 subunit, FliA/WhiG family [Caldicellulosiruptor saccharolyticus DSM 8903]
MSRASQEELISKAKNGDKKARQELIENNLALVWSIVKKFVVKGIEADDLFQIGCIGLIKAVDRFDLSFNVRFSTYAVPMIIGEIKRYLRDDGKIKISRKIKENQNKLKRFRDEFLFQNGREPTISEISEATGLSQDDILLCIDASLDVTSLNEVINQEEGKPITLMDIAADEDYSSRLLDIMALKEGLRKLKGRERYIIFMRYFKNKTQSEIAKELNISQVHVSRIEKKALERIKREFL